MPVIPLTIGQQLNQIEAGSFVTLQKIDPSGALQARKQSNGAINLYWRWNIGNHSGRVDVGLYDPLASPKSRNKTARGISVAGAISVAEEHANVHYENRDIGGYPEVVKRKLAEEEAKRAEADVQRAAQERAQKYTLARLLEDYANELERLGRSSHRDVRSIFRLHVLERWPEKANQSAIEITADEITDMQRAVINLGKGRTANKLRSYLRAAYQTAKKSRTKASIPEHFKAYGVRDNPVEDTEPDESANKPDKNPLSIEELCRYWQIIEPLGDFRGALLRLHLLTGGQRIEQLVKLKTRDIARDYAAFTLIDSKGRPGKEPRKHVVPLTAAAQVALRACNPIGEYALSTDGGTTHVTATTLSKWAVGVVEAVVANIGSGATAAVIETIPDFQAKRIRSGVETLLSTAGASLEIRGHLQSHGISGVQKRHYDGNDFFPAKLAALETLYRTLKSGELKKYKLA